MKRILCALTLGFLLTLAGCGGESLSSELQVDLSGGTVTEEEDSHGGFHGDGIHWVVMEFEEDISEALAASDAWKELPLTENLEKAVGYVHSDFPDWMNSPEGRLVQGYYFFRDDHSESTDPTDDRELFDRASYNFVLAIYDSAAQTLYYNETDT